MRPDTATCQFCGGTVIAARTMGSAGELRLFDTAPSQAGRWLYDDRQGIMLRYTADSIPDGLGHLPHAASCPEWQEPLAPVIALPVRAA